MKIEELKQKIESGTVDNSPLVMVYKDNGRVVCEQYIDAICKLLGAEKQYINEIGSNEVDLFGMPTDTTYVMFTDTLTTDVPDNYIVCCHKNKGPAVNVVEVPELEDWQIEDYVKGVLPGVSEDHIRWLCSNCTSISRLWQEVDKVKIFPKETQEIVFNSLIDGGNFDDLTSFNIFNLSNAIQKKDIKTLREIMLKIKYIDVNAIGLNNLLYGNFKDIAAIKMSPTALPQTLNIQPKKFNALKYYVNYFTADQLFKIIEILGKTDQQIKSGNLPTDILLDYLITNILSF